MTVRPHRSQLIRATGVASAAEVSALREWLASANHVAEHTAAQQHELRQQFEELREELSAATNVGRSVVGLSRRLVRENEELRADLDWLRDCVARLAGALAAGSPDPELTTMASSVAERVVAPRLTADVPPRSTAYAQLGRGSGWADQALRLDTVDSVGVELVVHPSRLPVAQSSLRELIIDRALERFDPERVRQELLPHWFGCLMPGGLLRVQCVDVDAVLGAWHEQRLSYDAVREALAGPSMAMASRSAYTAEGLTEDLESTGFEQVTTETAGPTSTIPTLTITARRPLHA